MNSLISKLNLSIYKKFNSKHSKSHQIYRLTIFSFYVALIILLSMVPYTGYIRILIINFTILPVFMVIASVHLGWLGGALTGLTIGLGSLIRAYLFGDATQMFYYPDISVLPRFLTGIILGLLVSKTVKLTNKFSTNWILIIFFGALSACLNTTTVTIFIFLHNAISPFPYIQNSVATLGVWIGLIYVNFIFEVCFATFLAFSLVNPMLYFKKQYNQYLARLY